MRNYFTISISDVHGTRHYSFKQVFKRFAWLIAGVFMLIWIAGGFSLWWLTFEADKIEENNRLQIETYNEALKQLRGDYNLLLKERDTIENALSQKSAQIEFLDSSLENLETLVGITVEEPEKLPYDERVKAVQLNTLGKTLMMNMVPSGRLSIKSKVSICVHLNNANLFSGADIYPDIVQYMKENFPGKSYQDLASELTAKNFNATDFAKIVEDSGAK